jgi:2-polyprenyl-6-hydroxyphenyl methylase/3-demethylubiquinone-9 3-methyltransferase
MRLHKTLGFVRKAVRAVIARLKNLAWKVLPYAPDRVPQKQYDALYSTGRLDYYKSVGELARYSVIVGYCHYFKPGGALLDLGCGAGILQERLNSNNYSCYVGVDNSKEAIAQALCRQDGKTFFLVADVNIYVPDRKFDVIIFNECLYHLDNALDIVKKYEHWLDDNGLFIISICDHERTKPLWKMVEALYRTEDAVQILHKSRLSWTVKVFGTSKDNV